MSKIGENIRRYRNETNLRQEDLAAFAGISVNYIGMIERGEKTPALDTFIDIMNALGVTADMLLIDQMNVKYFTNDSVLNDKLARLSESDRERIYGIVDTFLKCAKK